MSTTVTHVPSGDGQAALVRIAVTHMGPEPAAAVSGVGAARHPLRDALRAGERPLAPCGRVAAEAVTRAASAGRPAKEAGSGGVEAPPPGGRDAGSRPPAR